MLGNVVISKNFLRTHKIMVMHRNEQLVEMLVQLKRMLQLVLGNVVISKKILRTRKIMVMHSNKRGECCPRTLLDRKRKR